jgi:myo-inositol 2-dehydrogenase/D-chiro-inositol 1-dehydrogenase
MTGDYDMKKENIRLAVVGLGRLGSHYASNIKYALPGVDLAAVCSIDHDELNRAAEKFSPGYTTLDYMDIFKDASIDGIVIASSSALHARMIIDAAGAGVRNIYCEKPLGMNADEVENIRKAVEGSSVEILQMGFNRRFDASLRDMRARVLAGDIGDPVHIRISNRDPRWELENLLKFSPMSGGLVFDMLSHDYDIVRWITGSDAVTVYGIGGVFAYEGLEELGDIDNCILSMVLDNGVLCSMETSRSCPYGYHPEVEIFGTKGCLRMGQTPDKNRVLVMDEHGTSHDTTKNFHEFWLPTFAGELKEFSDAIKEGRAPEAAGLDDGIRAVKWAMAAKEAVASRTVVQVAT